MSTMKVPRHFLKVDRRVPLMSGQLPKNSEHNPRTAFSSSLFRDTLSCGGDVVLGWISPQGQAVAMYT